MSNELKMVEYQSISGIPVKLDADTVIQYCARGNGNKHPDPAPASVPANGRFYRE